VQATPNSETPNSETPHPETPHPETPHPETQNNNEVCQEQRSLPGSLNCL
jgi:hypothetical protein